MEILELVAEKALGKSVLARHSELKSGLRKIDKNTGTRATSQTSADEKQRIAGIIELCFEYKRETDPEERKNILRTLDEIVRNEAIELPIETIEDWDDKLAAEDREYRKLRASREFSQEIFFSETSGWA